MRGLVCGALLGLVGLPAPAEAADFYLAGGWTGAPSDVLEVAAGMPSWRLGVGLGRATVWTSGTWASFSLPDQEVSGSGWRPQLGVRLDLAERRPGGVTGTLGASAFTLGGAFDDGVERNEVDASLKRVVGGPSAWGWMRRSTGACRCLPRWVCRG